MEDIIRKIVSFCNDTLDLKEQVISYTYQSISICIIDCVFSLRARYNDSTIPVVNRYAKKYMNGDVNAPGNTITDLINCIEEAGGPLAFSQEGFLGNKQQSGGVLKTEVCYVLARYLKRLGIETKNDFENFDEPELLETVIHAVKGMGDAGTNYLFMLAGDPDRCKPDTHIHHFVRDACGKDLKNEEIQSVFREVVDSLSKDYPQLTVSMLDGIIWRKYQIANRN